MSSWQAQINSANDLMNNCQNDMMEFDRMLSGSILGQEQQHRISKKAKRLSKRIRTAMAQFQMDESLHYKVLNECMAHTHRAHFLAMAANNVIDLQWEPNYAQQSHLWQIV